MEGSKEKTKAFAFTDKVQPELLVAAGAGYEASVREQLEATGFTSLNSQSIEDPVFGSVYIEYVPGKLVATQESLKRYLNSFRMVSMLYEDIPARICEDLWKLLQPSILYVRGNFTLPNGAALSVDTYKGGTPAAPAAPKVPAAK